VHVINLSINDYALAFTNNIKLRPITIVIENIHVRVREFVKLNN